MQIEVMVGVPHMHRTCVEGELLTNKMKQEIVAEGKVSMK